MLEIAAFIFIAWIAWHVMWLVIGLVCAAFSAVAELLDEAARKE